MASKKPRKGVNKVKKKDDDVVNMLKTFKDGDNIRDIRVMQIAPDGSLVDVPHDIKDNIRPEDISGVMTEDGKTFPIGQHPQTREEAYEVLRHLLPRLQPYPEFVQAEGRFRFDKFGKFEDRLKSRNETAESIRRFEDRLKSRNETAESIRRMEQTLAQSEEILKHWK